MRPIWSGTISFGLVSVPVRMFPATQSKELRFHFLHKKDLTPIAYEKVRRDDRERVDPDEIVRGFEIEKGRYVPLEDEDLDRLDIELTHSIDICDFVDLDEIDPVYFRKAYYLLPAEGAEKPYRLLARALEETGKVGIAKVVIRNKQHLAALRPYDGVLLLETMYYSDEVRKPEALDGDVESPNLRKAEVDMAKSLVENLSEPFEPEKYDDTYRKELLDLIKAKAAGQPLPEPEQEPQGEVVDLMEALRESVERTKKQRKRAPLPRTWLRSSPSTSANAIPSRRRSPSVRRRERRRSRSSSSSVTMPGGCTTTSGSRRTGPCSAGQFRRAFPSSPVSSTSPFTSRTTRSSTRRSRGRSRKDSTGRAPSRSGTAARTSCWRRRRTAA
jgi:DNA end-binding protein Ku